MTFITVVETPNVAFQKVSYLILCFEFLMHVKVVGATLEAQL